MQGWAQRPSGGLAVAAPAGKPPAHSPCWLPEETIQIPEPLTPTAQHNIDSRFCDEHLCLMHVDMTFEL